MYLEKLLLKDFRSFKQVSVTFSPEINFIQGDNAQGKTNLLEAIFLLSTGRSFRTLNLKELIHHDSPYFYLEATFQKEGISHGIKAYFDGTKRDLQINDTRYPSFNPLFGLLPTILYAPEHSILVSGPPAERRRFLDLHLSQLDAHYLNQLTRYARAMKQRNALLKAESELGIESWEQMMADASYYIIEQRKKAILELLPVMQSSLAHISEDRDLLNLEYQSSFEEGVSFVEQLKNKRPKELSYQSSLIGPHRDDLKIFLNGQLARHFASEGQKRSLLTALKFGQWQRAKSSLRQVPILSIDDFGAHLDAKRRFLLQKQMQERGQIFLTAPHFEENAFSHLQRRTFHVERGNICVI